MVGGEMTDADFDLLAEIIRRRMAQAGAVNAVGRSLTWTSLARQRTVHVSVVSRNGKTTIRAAENLESLSRRARIMGIVGGGYLAAALMGVVMPMVVGKGPLTLVAALGTGLVAFGSVLTAGRYSFQKSARKRKARLHGVVQELVEQVTESVDATTRALTAGGRGRLEP